MDNKQQGIVRRLEEFGIGLCGSQRGWKKKFADQLGILPIQVSNLLTGKAAIGSLMQSRLAELGADVDYILTGRHDPDKSLENEIRIHFSGNASDSLKLRIQRLAEWILKYGQDADSAYIGYVTQKFMEGKVLDSDGKEIG